MSPWCLLVAASGLSLAYAGRRWDGERSLSEARQAVLSAERDRARFLASAGHDMRQPLQAMNLFLSTLAQRVEDTQSSELIAKVRTAARSMDRMLTGLLDVAKLDAGIVATDRVDVALARLIDGFRGEFERLAEANGLRFTVARTSVVVRTDPVLLESILRNLLSNAVKYTVAGGVTLSCQVSGHVAIISVQDTGPGIPEDEVASIFDDFYRVAGTATRSSGVGAGLGLGLGIVRRMAKLIGAPVGVVSTVGVGTTFTVEVALGAELEHTAPVSISHRMPRDAVMLAGRRIMMVEDDAPSREALGAVLRGWRMQVIAVAGSMEACQQFERGARPDIEIAVVDYHLGAGLTGPLLLDHLAATYALAIPAIVMTGSDDPEVLRDIEDSGYPLLRKPLDTVALQELMLEMLDRRLAPMPERSLSEDSTMPAI